MITLQPIVPPAYAIRICPDAVPGQEMPDFVGSGVLEVGWIDCTTAKLLALNAELTRPLMRELVRVLRERGIETLLSKRKDSHTIPCSVLRPDGYYETDLIKLAARGGC